MNITNYNPDYNPETYIRETEAVLEVIFDKYNNGRAFIRKPVRFVYKNSIKYVPERFKEDVQGMFDLLELLEAAKEVMTAVNNLYKESGNTRVMKRV